MAVPLIAGAALVGLIASTLTTRRRAAMWIAGTISALILWAPLVTVAVLAKGDVGDTRSEDLGMLAIFLLLVTAATCALLSRWHAIRSNHDDQSIDLPSPTGA